MLGSDVRIVHIKILSETELTLMAYSIRGVFDKKNVVNDLPFLSTGESFCHKYSEWVASPKASYVVASDHLFSSKKASIERLDIEEKLRSNGCTPTPSMTMYRVCNGDD